MSNKVVRADERLRINIQYHPGKVNVVVDALSQKLGGSLAALLTRQPRLLRDLGKCK